MSLLAAGVDVGSTQTKAVIMNEQRNLIATSLIPTGAYVTQAAESAFQQVLASAGVARADIGCVVGTGYGRYKVTFGDLQITEISCHARGAHFLFPGTRTVIDMGGQDSKAIKVGPDGDVCDFQMNDKCAAGTGRFLAAAAEVLDLPLDEIGAVSLRAKNPVRLSSVCAVFVESDIMSYLAQNKTVEDILGGVHSAIAARTVSLVRRVGVEDQITFTGGVSRNIAMVRALEEKLGKKLNVGGDAHFAGAIGAALFAMERAEKLSFEGLPEALFHEGENV
jgi:predicted CoA-substrate-specific enzyme activase